MSSKTSLKKALIPLFQNLGLKVVPPAEGWYCENVTGVDTPQFAKKNNSSSLKTEIDKLYIDKLVTNPNDLSKMMQ